MGVIRETSEMSDTERMAARNSNMQYLENIPHIIESGTDGIWSYRKWSDGTAECWGKSSVSADTSTQWAGYYTGVFGAINYPSNLFVEEPVLNCTLKTTSYPGHMFLGSDGSKSSTGGIALACHDKRTVSGYLHLTAKGKWK